MTFWLMANIKLSPVTFDDVQHLLYGLWTMCVAYHYAEDSNCYALQGTMTIAWWLLFALVWQIASVTGYWPPVKKGNFGSLCFVPR